MYHLRSGLFPLWNIAPTLPDRRYKCSLWPAVLQNYHAETAPQKCTWSGFPPWSIAAASPSPLSAPVLFASAVTHGIVWFVIHKVIVMIRLPEISVRKRFPLCTATAIAIKKLIEIRHRSSGRSGSPCLVLPQNTGPERQLSVEGVTKPHIVDDIYCLLQ